MKLLEFKSEKSMDAMWHLLKDIKGIMIRTKIRNRLYNHIFLGGL